MLLYGYQVFAARQPCWLFYLPRSELASSRRDFCLPMAILVPAVPFISPVERLRALPYALVKTP